ncbi:AP-4 complex subunit epsilon [Labeo rohita]|uniref:AP-4 complex subunit epsilon n=1 Tax=Labeo rohita TaxID=84645 RepID=A0ABQ8L1F8_LABRO|nr:AP-4 complex subunit epsilon [Labeo rohita]
MRGVCFGDNLLKYVIIWDNPHSQMSLLAAIDAVCEDITADAC